MNSSEPQNKQDTDDFLPWEREEKKKGERKNVMKEEGEKKGNK